MAKATSQVTTRVLFDDKNFAAGLERMGRDLAKARQQIGLLQKQAKEGGAGLDKLGDGVGSLVGKLSGLFAGALSVQAGVGFIKNYAADLDNIGDAAGGLGLTVAQLAALRFASEQLGLNADVLPKIFTNVAKSVGEAKDEASETAAIFKVLGLNAKQLQTLRPDEIFFKMVEALRQVPTWQQRVEVGMKLFGKSQEEVRKLLSYTNQEIVEQLRLGEELNANTDEAAEAAGRLDNEVRVTTTSLKAMVNESGVIPWMAETATWITKLIQGYRQIRQEASDTKRLRAKVEEIKQADERAERARLDRLASKEIGPVDRGPKPIPTAESVKQAMLDEKQRLDDIYARAQAAIDKEDDDRAAEQLKERMAQLKAVPQDAAKAAAFDAKLKAAKDAGAAEKKSAGAAESAAKKAEAEAKQALEEAKRRSEELARAMAEGKRAGLSAGVSGAEGALSAFQTRSDLDLALGRTTRGEVLQRELELRKAILDAKAKEADYDVESASSQAEAIAALEKRRQIEQERGLLGTQSGLETLRAGDGIIGDARGALGNLQGTLGRNENLVNAGQLAPGAAKSANEAALDSFRQKIAAAKQELTALFNAEGIGGDALKQKLEEIDDVAAQAEPKIGGLTSAAHGLAESFGAQATQGLSSFFTGLVDGSASGGEAFGNMLKQMGVQLLSTIATMLVATAVQSIFTFGANVPTGIAAFAAVQPFLASIASGAGGLLKRSGGGPIPGHDPTDSDGVPAMLTAGEYVHNRQAVNYYGHDFMEAINQRLLPRELLEGLPSPILNASRRAIRNGHFATGGAVAPGDGVGGGGMMTPILVVSEKGADEIYRGGDRALKRALKRQGIRKDGRR